MPARSNSPFLTGCFSSAARNFKSSSTRYSDLGMVKLSRTSFIFFGLSTLGALLSGEDAVPFTGDASVFA